MSVARAPRALYATVAGAMLLALALAAALIAFPAGRVRQDRAPAMLDFEEPTGLDSKHAPATASR